MKSKTVKWLSVFVVLVVLAIVVPHTAMAENSVSGTFPNRTFSVTRMSQGSPRTDCLAVDVLPDAMSDWWVTVETIAGSKIIVQVWRNDSGVLTLQSSSKLRAVGEESTHTPLVRGAAYVAMFIQISKVGTSVLREHCVLSALPPGELFWIRQSGWSDFYYYDVAVDETGVYESGEYDHFCHPSIRKYDPNGNEVWTCQLGTPDESYLSGIVVGVSGIYLTGGTTGVFPGQENEGSFDVFIQKCDLNGNEIWTRQFGTEALDGVNGIAIDASGVYVVGATLGTLPGQTSAGAHDVFICKYDLDGEVLWTHQFGTSWMDCGEDVAVDQTGVYVVGTTYGGTFPGQENEGSFDAFIRKYDSNGNEIWTSQFGTLVRDWARAVAVDASGVYMSGQMDCDLSGQTSACDAFVRKYDHDGNEVWTRLFGTPSFDEAGGVAVDASGVYVAGHTDGTLPDEVSAGGPDAFVRKYDSDGNELWTKQFGAWGEDTAGPIAVGECGLYVAGCSWLGSWNWGDWDVFVARLSP